MHRCRARGLCACTPRYRARAQRRDPYLTPPFNGQRYIRLLGTPEAMISQCRACPEADGALARLASAGHGSRRLLFIIDFVAHSAMVAPSRRLKAPQLSLPAGSHSYGLTGKDSKIYGIPAGIFNDRRADEFALSRGGNSVSQSPGARILCEPFLPYRAAEQAACCCINHDVCANHCGAELSVKSPAAFAIARTLR